MKQRDYTSLDQFINDLPNLLSRAEEKLRGHSGAFLVETTQGQTRYVLLNNGEVTLPDALPGEPDASVLTDERVLLDIINGRLNPAKAILLRKIRIRGSIPKLMELALLV